MSQPGTAAAEPADAIGRPCVVGLGAGRSGTSLAMSLLQRVGLRLSDDLVGASPDNPDGHFEDARIVALQGELTRSARFDPLLPRPPGWQEAPAYGGVVSALRTHVAGRLAIDGRVWGFKDPQTCSFWPMWRDVLHDVGAVPSVFFCVRPSDQIVRSMMVAYAMPQDEAEGVVLYRTMYALAEVDRPLFLVDHRRWRSDPVDQLAALSRHCGLDDGSVDYGSVVQRRYRPDLDRSSAAPEVRVGAMLRKVDAALAGAAGADYDRTAVGELCAEFLAGLDDLDFVVRGVERLRRRRAESALPGWAVAASRRVVRVTRAGAARRRRPSGGRRPAG